MANKVTALGIGCFIMCACAYCSKSSPSVQVLKEFPLDSVEGIIAQSDVQLDKDVSSDGHGSLKIITKEPLTVKLLEVEGINIDDARLIYEAKVKTEGLEGKAYLEMWCQFLGKGEFFSRGLQTTASGNTGWMTMETPFFLQKGEKPERIKLNLVVEGKGTVWIDHLRLIKGPLK
jgi:hypothetical protein